MGRPDESKWIKFQFINEKGYSVINYEDGLGQKITVSLEGGKVFIDFIEELIPGGISYPGTEKMTQYIRNVWEAAPQEHVTGSNGDKRIPLAVYLDITADQYSKYSHSSLEYSFLRALGQILPEASGNFQFIYYSNKTESKKPFSLPFNVRFSGEEIDTLMDNVKTEWWYKSNEDIRRLGFNIKKDTVDFNNLDEVDILILSEPEFIHLIKQHQETGISVPRLLIINSRSGFIDWDLHPFADYDNLPGNCLFIAAPSVDIVKGFIRDFMHDIIHDFPLHEALHHAKQKYQEMRLLTSFYSSPVANQYLRMRDAFDSFKADVHKVSNSIIPGDVTNFLEKFSDTDAAVTDQIRNAITGNTELNDYFREVKSFNRNFNGETTGLVPIANAKAVFRDKEATFQKRNLDLKELVNNDIVFNLIRKKQERKVDITLDELSHYLIYRPLAKGRVLRWDSQYRINVSIGQSSEFSLMEGVIPSIDPLLPDPENSKGHEIDIVIYPKEFTLLSPSCQTVYLPLLGGTNPVSFYLKAPSEGEIATLRVCIFHKNVLLQAFLLKGRFNEVQDESSLSVKLDLCTSEKFTNLDSLKPRALYIGVNGNRNSTHTLFIKKDDFAEEISGLNEEVIKEAQEEFKELLNTTYYNKNVQKYNSTAQPGSEINPVFSDDVRKLARFGQKYFLTIFLSNEEVQEKLRDLRARCDQDITIGRHQINFAFPWVLLYDYNLPDDIVGGAVHPVCMGQRLNPALYNDSVRTEGKGGCPHNPDLNTYCLDGFWGIRHRIEQVLADHAPSDAKTTIQKVLDKNIIFCDNVNDNYSINLCNALVKAHPSLVHIKHDSDLPSLLWDKTTRPSSLIVLGHLETKDIQDEPKGPRIITFPKKDWPQNAGAIPAEKWFNYEQLARKIVNVNHWTDDPHPLIFLINCSNAEMNVSSLSSIVKGFHFAGATAVVGTECDITSSLGARFVNEVMDSIYNRNMELGEAIQQFNKNLFASGIPLAFVFTCFGNINVKMIN